MFLTLCLSFLSVVAKTTVAEASQLLVIQALVPFSTHSSPSCWASVDAAPASLPLPGAERDERVNSGKKRERGKELQLRSKRSKWMTSCHDLCVLCTFECVCE